MTKNETRPVRTLLIEDQLSAAMITAHMLNNMAEISFDIGHALTLADGLVAIVSGLDLIIADLNLPNGMGLQTLVAIKRKADPLGIPVVVITADSHYRTSLEAGRLQVDGYLAKSTFTEDELSGEIAHAISKKRADLDLAAYSSVLNGVKQMQVAKTKAHAETKANAEVRDAK